ncbi:MAG: T9SS type A sorting domain-containing protein [Bacteroidia bacterium]|nr:T9SS type A sorting domain-containing protein [Bacteroidia bacterium]
MLKKVQQINFLFSVFCLLITVPLKSQDNYHELKIKEHYDDIYIGAYEFPPAVEGFVTPINYDNLTAHGTTLESMLIMYETTKDKAYLYKFIRYTKKILYLRGSDFYWSFGIHFNARLLWPMAHFVYLVKVYEPDLKTQSLNPHPALDLSSNDYSTFEEFADWLSDRVKETLNAAEDDLWRDPYIFFGSLDDETLSLTNWNPSISPAILNFQAPWGLTYIYMYLAEGYNNSYWWYHKGWGEEIKKRLTCSWDKKRRICSKYIEGIESIAYGSWDIMFPLLYNKYADNFNPHLTSGLYFEDYQMVRFRNTFTKNLYAGSGNFHCAVDGTDGPIFVINDIITCTDNYLRSDCPAWMPLYKFDDIGDGAYTVYEIIMNYYNNFLKNSSSSEVYSYFAPMKYKGLTDIVSAQWNKECPNINLTLKNRKVVYDQDFFAQDSLIIDASAPNDYYTSIDSSFADPKIVEDKFIIEPGITVNMKASNKIILRHGFHAKEGCHFHAYIEPTVCNAGKQMLANSGKNYPTEYLTQKSLKEDPKEEKPENEINIVKEKNLKLSVVNKINIYPNPNTGIFTISHTGYSHDIMTIEVCNMIYSNIFTKKIQSNYFDIDISTYPKGIYFVKATIGNKVFIEKLIYQ